MHCVFVQASRGNSRSRSSTQANVALSSGEAEYYGLVKGSIRVSTDASVAKGIASRRGLGKVRHIEVHQLWVQDKVASGETEIRNVEGKTNIDDGLTKHAVAEDIRIHMHHTSQHYACGRHGKMPQVAN